MEAMLWIIQDWLKFSTKHNLPLDNGDFSLEEVVEMIQDLGEVVYLDFPHEGKAFTTSYRMPNSHRKNMTSDDRKSNIVM